MAKHTPLPLDPAIIRSRAEGFLFKSLIAYVPGDLAGDCMRLGSFDRHSSVLRPEFEGLRDRVLEWVDQMEHIASDFGLKKDEDGLPVTPFGPSDDPLGWDESLTESKYDSAPLANKGPFHEAWDREEDQLKIDDEQGYLEQDDPIGPDISQFDDTE